MMLPVPFEKIKISADDVSPGDWFLPVDREGACQHGEISAALKKGASGFSFEESKEQLLPLTVLQHKSSAQRLPTKNARELLYALAAKKRQQSKAAFVAVAGSHGKTTVKEMLASILRGTGQPFHHSPDIKNTLLSLASQLLSLDDKASTAVFELGARRTGDLEAPLRFLAPGIVALLRIGRAHIGEFGSEASLKQEKLRVLRADSAHTLIVPIANEEILKEAKASGKKTVLTFGENAAADFLARIQDGMLEIRGTEAVSILVKNRNTPGFAENAAAAAAIARALGVHWDSIQKGLESFECACGRFEARAWMGKTIIDDAFNASPESVHAGLACFFEGQCGNRLALAIGALKELGGESDSIHEELGRQLGLAAKKSLSPVLLVTVGKEADALAVAAQSLHPAIRWKSFASAALAEAYLKESSNQWDSLYLKGSKASGLIGLLR